MRIEDAAGNTTAVRAVYRELLDYLEDLDAEPSAETTAFYERKASVTAASRTF
ncbi:MAG: hypothetical protein MUF83_20960 [Acidimicrobiales bacterium]|jgi:hypothetical protein|nr:hypothetical protein [Acidimicrobiales bacterium]